MTGPPAWAWPVPEERSSLGPAGGGTAAGPAKPWPGRCATRPASLLTWSAEIP
jgi:hypothetical protein